MWRKIRRSIAEYLLREEVEAIESLQVVTNMLSKSSESMTINDMVRENLKGFDFRKKRGDLFSDIPKDRTITFLASAVDLQKSETLNYVMEFVKAEQIDYTVHEAQTIEHVNFGRATLNGVELIEAAIASLVVEYEKRHEDKEDFDKHKAV